MAKQNHLLVLIIKRNYKMRSILLKSKRSQAQVITTVLLILISIAVFAVVAVFVRNYVRDKLPEKGCFEASQGQLEIDTKSGFTYYDGTSANKGVVISVKRGTSTQFNLTGFILSISAAGEDTPYTIISGEATTAEVKMYNTPSTGGQFTVPSPGGRKTYNISSDSIITHAEITPIVNGKQCDQKADDTDVPQK